MISPHPTRGSSSCAGAASCAASRSRAQPRAVREAGHDTGLLIATAGDDVLRLLPPLIFERAHVDEAVEKLGQALR